MWPRNGPQKKRVLSGGGLKDTTLQVSKMEQTLSYIKRLGAIRADLAKDPNRPEPSWVRITTITMGSKFQSEIDLAKFHTNFAKLGSITIREQGSTGQGFEWKMSDAAFYNQVTIGYRDKYSGKSIKIFPNGAIQVAGCASLFDCKRILQQLSFIMSLVLELEEPIQTVEPQIWMINTNFSINASVNLNKVIAKLRPLQTQFKVFFEPSRYSAVMVKFVPGPGMKQVSASIFKTGKIIVTGAQKLEEIAESYNILNRIIDPSIMVSPVENPEKFDVFLGWTFEEWLAQDKNV